MDKTKTILVTGGAGHVGSHVVEALLANGNNKVISLDNYFNGSKKNHIDGAEYRQGHTKDVEKLIPETPDIVYHLGEYARIAASFDDIKLVYDLNIAGTFAVAEFCRVRKTGKLVYAASSTKFAVEGDGRNQNPYAFSKAVNVDLINNYGRWYNLPYAICYFYNAFGPRENGEGNYATLIAKFQRQYLAGQALTVVAPGTQRRAFTYVKDLACGLILVGEKGAGDGYALGADKSYSVMEIARAFGGKIEMVEGYAGRADSTNDQSKAAGLGWKPSLDVMDYIKDFKNKHPLR